MPTRASSPTRADIASGLASLLRDLSAESADALDRLAALATEALASGDAALAAASAGVVVLAEHVQSANCKHSARMLAVLSAAGPAAADGVGPGSAGLLAWAGAAVARDYGVLPSWPRADIGLLIERAQQAPPDLALALGCALGEVCERNGLDAEFAALQAHLAPREFEPDASPFWRGYWAITSAWHLYSFGKRDEALRRLDGAQALALQQGLRGLGATAALQRARLIDTDGDPRLALQLVLQATAHGDPVHTPLWFADAADVRCRMALVAADFHAAVGHARTAMGCLQAAGVWPGYQATYRLNEAYALLGTGAIDEALGRLHAIRETPLPPYLLDRVRCLIDLAALSAADRGEGWGDGQRLRLAQVLRRLRELEWISALPLLPELMARLLARALASGIEVDWVRATIRSRRLQAPRGAPDNWPWAATVRILGGFQVSAEAGPLRSGSPEPRKAASKSLELLRLLATQGHAAASTDSVAEALWPGDGREGRRKAFEITVARLRSLLGSDQVVIVSDRRVRLNPQCVWIDAQALTDCLVEGDAAPESSPALGRVIDAALTLYRGPCLPDSPQAWAASARERLRGGLAVALVRALRGHPVSVSKRQEWMLRAASVDPALSQRVGPSGA